MENDKPNVGDTAWFIDTNLFLEHPTLKKTTVNKITQIGDNTTYALQTKNIVIYRGAKFVFKTPIEAIKDAERTLNHTIRKMYEDAHNNKLL